MTVDAERSTELQRRVADLEADNQLLRETLQRAIDALAETDLDLGRARLMIFLLSLQVGESVG